MACIVAPAGTTKSVTPVPWTLQSPCCSDTTRRMKSSRHTCLHPVIGNLGLCSSFAASLCEQPGSSNCRDCRPQPSPQSLSVEAGRIGPVPRGAVQSWLGRRYCRPDRWYADYRGCGQTRARIPQTRLCFPICLPPRPGSVRRPGTIPARRSAARTNGPRTSSARPAAITPTHHRAT